MDITIKQVTANLRKEFPEFKNETKLTVGFVGSLIFLRIEDPKHTVNAFRAFQCRDICKKMLLDGNLIRQGELGELTFYVEGFVATWGAR